MNWSKIKNVMIIILVTINLFLLADIAFVNYTSQALPEGAAESFVSLLNKRDITLEEELVPARYESRRIVSAAYYDIDRLTEIFLGEKTMGISDGKSITATANDKRITLNGASIEYTTLRDSVEKRGDDILRALKNTGISMTGAYYDRDSQLVKVMIDKEKLEGVFLDVALTDENEIAYARGVWPIITVTGTDEKVSVIQSVNEICEVLPRGSQIIDIEKIYILRENDDIPKVVYGWRVFNQGRGYTVS